MFKIVDQERLMTIPLVGREGRHQGLRCAITNLSFSYDTNDLTLHIKSHEKHGHALNTTLRKAAQKYAVTDVGRSQNGQPAPELLGAYLTRRCDEIKRCWPNHLNQQHTLDRLWSSKQTSRDGPGPSPWIDLAREWLKLESVRGAAPLQTDPARFFQELSQWLADDEKHWMSRPDQPKTDQRKSLLKGDLRLAPKPKPLSLTLELRRVLARARSAAALRLQKKVDLGPFLENALESYWLSIISGTSLLKDSVGLPNTVGTRLVVQVVECDFGILRSGKRQAKCEVNDVGDAVEIKITFRFSARKTPAEEEVPWTVATTIRCEKRSERVRVNHRRCKSLISFHLNDIVWCLGKHFQQNWMTITADGRLFFDSREDFHDWLVHATTHSSEFRLQLLKRTWSRAGPPSVEGIDQAAVRAMVAAWLAVMATNQGPTLKSRGTGAEAERRSDSAGKQGGKPLSLSDREDDRRAAIGGDSEAQYREGTRCLEGAETDPAAAVKWLQKAAKTDHAAAQNDLGLCYLKGTGTQRNEKKALHWFRKAAERGSLTGMLNAGICFANGYGGARDDAEAVRWYRKAAQKGHASAQYSLARHYRDGDGVKQDHVEAVSWYEKAAQQGHAGALNILGDCHYNGLGVPKNKEEAFRYYQKAASAGSAAAKYNAGLCYALGEGAPQDDQQAFDFFRKSAEGGYADAQWEVAKRYFTGQGVRRDDCEALAWHRRALLGHAMADPHSGAMSNRRVLR